MTNERNPQEPVRELPTPADHIAIEISAILNKFLDVPACSPEPYNRVCHDLAELFQSKLASSQLAGAVPQEELRELIDEWRHSLGEHNTYGACECLRCTTFSKCADALESLIERRSK